MKFGELVSTIANLGVKKEGPHTRFVATSTKDEIRAIGLAITKTDIKDSIISVQEEGGDPLGPSLVYLVDTEKMREVVEKRYSNLLKPFGMEPIIQTREVKRGQQTIKVIDVPYFDAQTTITRSHVLRTLVPRLYRGKNLEKENSDFNTCGAGIRRTYTEFALGRIGTEREQIQIEESGYLTGRIKNLTAEVAVIVGQKTRKVFRPHIRALPIENMPGNG